MITERRDLRKKIKITYFTTDTCDDCSGERKFLGNLMLYKYNYAKTQSVYNYYIIVVF